MRCLLGMFFMAAFWVFFICPVIAIGSIVTGIPVMQASWVEDNPFWSLQAHVGLLVLLPVLYLMIIAWVKSKFKKGKK